MDYSPGLRGVIAGETEISTVGMEGTSLRYRGYDAINLTKSHTYEDVASLIIDDNLDGKLFKETFIKHYEQLLDDQALLNLIKNLRVSLHPMDVMRTAISYIGQADESNKLHAASKVTAISCIVIA
ncbi:MAG: citrate/2-methylcitrate synthase, partial [Flavobacteriales bacterium]